VVIIEKSVFSVEEQECMATVQGDGELIIPISFQSKDLYIFFVFIFIGYEIYILFLFLWG